MTDRDAQPQPRAGGTTHSDALASFHPLVARWFTTNYAKATNAQQQSWPLIAAGRNVLVTAPTGSGKTLTGFLWALNQFATGALKPGATRVLYVSPLKALNNDIQRNLVTPIAGLQAQFTAAGEHWPQINLAVRSGDTPAAERARMLRRPPEILITTPESLLLILTTARGRQALCGVHTLILDEIHAVADNRRGVTLMAAVERLVALSGEVQRIALSATVNPVHLIAQFVGGFAATGPAGTTATARQVEIVAADDACAIDLRVHFPAGPETAAGEQIWQPLVRAFHARIANNRATLLFTNSRRLAEQLTFRINADLHEPMAYAHHGSLSREVRTRAEARLKEGSLRAIVATSSLELGIDIGELDEVLLIQSPPTVAATLQRIGRAGHAVGATSRGILYPTHGRDLIQAAALAAAVAARDLEPVAPINGALDVLVQLIIAFTAGETWRLDDLFALLRRSYGYRALPRERFDQIIDMLTGRYGGARLRVLTPRLNVDRIAGTATATRGGVLALYSSGGSIPDRGYYQLRSSDGALIGELDEEFVWEARPGQQFTFGTQTWQIQQITHNDVVVTPARAGSTAPPFWRSEAGSRSFAHSAHVGDFLERCEKALADNRDSQVHEQLEQELGFDADAAAALLDFLRRQRMHTAVALPHSGHLVIEHISAAPRGHRSTQPLSQLALHTLWGGRVNRPLAMALAASWENAFGIRPEVYSDDDLILIQTDHIIDGEQLLRLVNAGNIAALLQRSLEGSGFFGARFRECAGRALLIGRERFNHRLPLWLRREQSKRLLAAVRKLPDFPVLIEAWRSCLQDEFELPALERQLNAVADGSIRISTVASRQPSPFAASAAWSQINQYMYADDQPHDTGPGAAGEDLIRAAVFDDAVRPQLDSATVETFESKRQRTAPGYAPESTVELAAWLKERVLIPEEQWQQLTDSIEAKESSLPDALAWLSDGRQRWACHREDAAHLRDTLFPAGMNADSRFPAVVHSRDPVQLLQQILSFHGPLTLSELTRVTPLRGEALQPMLMQLIDEDALIRGRLLQGSNDEFYCDTDNLETLLRFQRAAARPTRSPHALSALPGFIAAWHEIGGRVVDGGGTDARTAAALDLLRGYRAPVDVWLNDLLPARGADEQQVDALLAEGLTIWLGCGRQLITFMDADELTAIVPVQPRQLRGLFRDPSARYGFSQLAEAAGEAPQVFNGRFWEAVWNGALSADSVAPLRAAMARNFELEPAPKGEAAHHGALARRDLRRRIARRVAGWPGNWCHVAARFTNEPTNADGGGDSNAADDRDEGVAQTDGADALDAIDAFEHAKACARLLLDRYGIVCRELVNRDASAGGTNQWRWRTMFRALRIMELSGEIVSGRFFEGLSGPQFALPSAVDLWAGADSASSRAFWVNAMDPVAPCGLGVDWPGVALPARRAGNYLVFSGDALVMTAENNGSRLRVAEAIDKPAERAIHELLGHLLQHRRALRVTTVNDEDARNSAFIDRLRDSLDVGHDHRAVELRPGSAT